VIVVDETRGHCHLPKQQKNHLAADRV